MFGQEFDSPRLHFTGSLPDYVCQAGTPVASTCYECTTCKSLLIADWQAFNFDKLQQPAMLRLPPFRYPNKKTPVTDKK